MSHQVQLHLTAVPLPYPITRHPTYVPSSLNPRWPLGPELAAALGCWLPAWSGKILHAVFG
jgi:hypothetical protein